MTNKNKQEQQQQPEEVEDIKVEDPITKKAMVVEGEHFDINKEAKNRKIDPFTDSNGTELSDRIVAKLAEDYADFPDNYNFKDKDGEPQIREVEDHDLVCEKQWYKNKETGEREYIIRSFEKKYQPAINRLRNIQKGGNPNEESTPVTNPPQVQLQNQKEQNKPESQEQIQPVQQEKEPQSK